MRKKTDQEESECEKRLTEKMIKCCGKRERDNGKKKYKKRSFKNFNYNLGSLSQLG